MVHGYFYHSKLRLKAVVYQTDRKAKEYFLQMLDQGRKIAKDGIINIRVLGEPQPFPKKEIGKRGDQFMPRSRDYRTRTDPITKDKIKYAHGHKRRWMDHVGRSVVCFMEQNKLRPFPKNHPVALGCLFYLTKAVSNKLWQPSQAPDADNFEYGIWNALKRTPAKKRIPGAYPMGILFYEDDQIIWRLMPSGKLWATEQNPPGVLITVADALHPAIKPQIEKYTS